MEEADQPEQGEEGGVTADERETVWLRGDPAWAQSREVAHHRSPDRVLMEREDALSFAAALGQGDTEAERIEHWRAFVGYLLQNGRCNPWEGFKNFLAVVRRVAPEALDGATATEIGVLLGEGKAAVSAREIRVVEGLMRRWGVLGFHTVGLLKGEDTREASRRSAKGNKNRRKRKGI